MARSVFIFLLAAAGLLSSCKKEQNIHTLGIDIQSYFSQDNVKVLVDGKELLNKKLTTISMLGVCLMDGQVVSTQNNGSHQIKVIINNSIVKEETFSLHDDLYIGVNYDQNSNISLVYSNNPFLYG